MERILRSISIRRSDALKNLLVRKYIPVKIAGGHTQRAQVEVRPYFCSSHRTFGGRGRSGKVPVRVLRSSTRHLKLQPGRAVAKVPVGWHGGGEDLLLDGFIEHVTPQIINGVTDRAHIFRQTLRQTAVEDLLLHVDHNAVDLLVGEHPRQLFDLLRYRSAGHEGHVAGAVGQNDQQGLHIRVQDLLARDDLPGHLQASREGRLAADRDARQRALRQQYRIGRRQHQGSAVFLEDDQPDPVAALVGVGQQRQDRRFGRLHALGDRHRPGAIDQKEDQVGGLAHAHFFLKIVGTDGKSDLALLAQGFAAALIGRGGAQCGVKSHIAAVARGWARHDVAPAFGLGHRLGTSAALFADHFVERGVELARLKGLAWLDHLAAVPPVWVKLDKYVLLRLAHDGDLRVKVVVFVV